jgi:amino acid transporter
VDIFSTTIKYLHDFAATSEATYHVNPWIFLILFFGSAIPLYFGYFMIAKSALKIEGHKLKRKKIDKRQLRIGIIISVIAWWVPYVYVMIYGKLPLNLWLIFLLFILATGFLFIKTLHSKITKAEKG